MVDDLQLSPLSAVGSLHPIAMTNGNGAQLQWGVMAMGHFSHGRYDGGVLGRWGVVVRGVMAMGWIPAAAMITGIYRRVTTKHHI